MFYRFFTALIFPVLTMTVHVVWADSVAILTSVSGTVELFSHPSQKIHDTVPSGSVRAKYEGVHYISSAVKAGNRLPVGAWLRTRPAARARVIFSNGDQLNVGPASFIKIDPPKGKAPESMELRYGIVRSIISKDGPRNRFKVRTSSAVMGVRGTDFVVESGSATNLTLIRGSVEVITKTRKAMNVTAGETALIENQKKYPSIQFLTSQEELRRLVALTEKPGGEVESSKSAELNQLEDKAREVTLKDLIDHASNSDERSKIELLVKKGASASELNHVAVKIRVDQAPADSPGLRRLKEEMRKRGKISAQELEEVENLEKDPYGKYFEGTQSTD